MGASWTELLTWGLMLVAFTVIAWLGWRRVNVFSKTVKRNREAGVYGDPEFKRRIRPLNILHWSLLAVEMLLTVAAIWASQVGVAPALWWAVFLILFIPTEIARYLVGRRVKNLMTKGIERQPGTER